MKTALTEILEIEYPIIQGGMAWVAEANLAAAVSNAARWMFLKPIPAEWPFCPKCICPS